MTAKELRAALDASLSGLDGDTARVRKLVFDLHGQLQAARQRQAVLEQQVKDVREQAAVIHTEREGLRTTTESLRQQLAGLDNNCHRLEESLRQAEAEPVLLLKRIREGLEKVRPRLTAEFADDADARLAKTLVHSLGFAEGELQFTPEQARALCHLGFSEYHLASLLSGEDGTAFTFLVES
jgi:chromosome segregation ATPase